MLSRTLAGGSRAVTCLRCANRRGYAAAASPPAPFRIGEAASTKIAAKDIPGATSTLAVVSKAGTRYQWVPGLSEGLEGFAFRNTKKRFCVRIVREIELLGAEIFHNYTREAIVFGNRMLKEDLPYFLELYAEMMSETKYQHHMYDENIKPAIVHAHEQFLSNPSSVALNAAHDIAFHRGLGNPFKPTSSMGIAKVMPEEIEAYAAAAYAKPNFAIIGSGVDFDELSKWTGQFFKDVRSTVPADLPKLESPAAKYYGGEERIFYGTGNAVVLAYPGSSSYGGQNYVPEVEVLAALLGGRARVKWGNGSSLLGKTITKHPNASIDTSTSTYGDAGLLHITVSGGAADVAAATKDVIQALNALASGDIPKEDLAKAVAQAKFKALEKSANPSDELDVIGLDVIRTGKAADHAAIAKTIQDVSMDKIKTVAKKVFGAKPTIASVGNLDKLPYAEELGINL